MHAAGPTTCRRRHDQCVLESLMIPFTVIVVDELRDGLSEVALAERNHPVETFFFDGSHEALRVGIRIRRPHGRQHDANPGVAQHPPHVLAPCPIAIADQDRVIAQQPDVRCRQRATDLAHEQRVRIGRGPDNLDTAGREIDHEHRVVRHQPAPRPDLGREEIRARDRAPVRAEKRLPGRRPLRYGRQAVRLQDARDR